MRCADSELGISSRLSKAQLSRSRSLKIKRVPGGGRSPVAACQMRLHGQALFYRLHVLVQRLDANDLLVQAVAGDPKQPTSDGIAGAPVVMNAPINTGSAERSAT